MTEEIQPPASTAIVAPSGEPVTDMNMKQLIWLAKTFAPSGLIPAKLQHKPADVLIILMLAQELGLPSKIQALNSIYVWNGQPTLSAQLAVALCLRRREVCQFFRLVESTAKSATYETQRVGSPSPARVTWTLEMAERAGLLGKDIWKKYPEAMLRNRAAMALARSEYPDLLANCYDPEEVDAPPMEWAERGHSQVAAPPPQAEAFPEDADPQTGEVLEPPEVATPDPFDQSTPEGEDELYSRFEKKVRGAPDKAAASREFNFAPPPIRKRLTPVFREVWGAR